MKPPPATPMQKHIELHERYFRENIATAPEVTPYWCTKMALNRDECIGTRGGARLPADLQMLVRLQVLFACSVYCTSQWWTRFVRK